MVLPRGNKVVIVLPDLEWRQDIYNFPSRTIKEETLALRSSKPLYSTALRPSVYFTSPVFNDVMRVVC